MGRMNWARIALGALVAAIVLFVLDGVIHSTLLKSDWMRVMGYLGRRTESDSAGMPWFALYDLCKGVGIALLYALVRPRLGPGVRTALIAGVIVWALAIPVPLFGQMPFGVWGRRLPGLWSIYTLIPHALAGIVAGALYQEEAA